MLLDAEGRVGRSAVVVLSARGTVGSAAASCAADVICFTGSHFRPSRWQTLILASL